MGSMCWSNLAECLMPSLTDKYDDNSYSFHQPHQVLSQSTSSSICQVTWASVSLWRDPDDVSHCRILSPDKTEWRLISATLCEWRRCFVADQLWFMTCIREEEEEASIIPPLLCSKLKPTFSTNPSHYSGNWWSKMMTSATSQLSCVVNKFLIAQQ